MAGLTVEIKLRFRDRLVRIAGLTVEIKLRFRDRLVWMAGLTVEIYGVQSPPKINFGTQHRTLRFNVEL